MERHVLKHLEVCEVSGAAKLVNVDWHTAWRLMERAVERGLSRKEHRLPARIGIDEKSFKKFQLFETIVCNLDTGTVEFVGDHRRQTTLNEYFERFTEAERAQVEAVALDMWDPYIAAVRRYIPNADQKIVFDRYHVMRHITDAVDLVRKRENRELIKVGDERLKRTKYLWIKNEENLSEQSKEQFENLRKVDLKVARAWSLKENLRHLWSYKTKGWAERYLKRWYYWATHSKLTPVIKAARTIRRYQYGILNYAKHRVTNALTERINGTIEKIKRKSHGFRNRRNYKTAIYFHCGGLDMMPLLRNG